MTPEPPRATDDPATWSHDRLAVVDPDDVVTDLRAALADAARVAGPHTHHRRGGCLACLTATAQAAMAGVSRTDETTALAACAPVTAAHVHPDTHPAQHAAVTRIRRLVHTRQQLVEDARSHPPPGRASIAL